jgi:hypothetical protein
VVFVYISAYFLTEVGGCYQAALNVSRQTTIALLPVSGGAITTKRAVNYENDPKTFNLIVIATDSNNAQALQSSATLTILINDLNEAPTFSPAAPINAPTISENAVTSVYSMTYSDQDRPTQSMTYSIQVAPSVTPAAPFWIDSSGKVYFMITIDGFWTEIVRGFFNGGMPNPRIDIAHHIENNILHLIHRDDKGYIKA